MKIEEIKARISIIEFIKSRNDLPFRFYKDGKDIKASLYKTDSKGEIQYNEGKPLKIQSIVISRILDDRSDSGVREIYFDHNSFVKGKSKSIIDFVSEFVLRQSSVNFKQCTKILYDYMNSSNYVALKDSTMPVFERKINAQKSQPTKLKMDFPTKASFDYLKSRKIPSSTYASPIFLGTFGSLTDVSNEDDKYHIIDKPCFPLLTPENKIQTIQYINESGPKRIKRFLKDVDRNGGMHTSQKQKNSNTLILSESPEKSMAHYALYKVDLDQYRINPVYKSPCGNMTLTDINAVCEYSKNHKINNYVLAFDNDKAGKLFTINTILGIRNLTCSINTNDLTKPNTISFIGVRPTINTLSKILNIPDSGTSELIVDKGADFIIDSLKTNNIQVHKSITKDFLDDLEQNLYLPKKFNKNNSISL